MLWLLVAILPFLAAGVLFTRHADRTITERSQSNLLNLLELEVGRIEAELDKERNAVVRAAQRDEFVDAVEEMTSPNELSGSAMPGTGTSVFDQASAELATLRESGQQLEELMMVDRTGALLGKTDGFSWTPADAALVDRSMEERRPLFGDAFVSASGIERLGVSVPVVTDDGAVLGALLAETRLAPIVNLSQMLEDYGDTSEALIIQRTSRSTGEPITLRRFERGAAFRALVDLGGTTPSARSLGATEPRVIQAVDYRGAETVAAIGYIDRTDWGVVIKIDEDEAFAVARDLNRFATIAFLMTLGVIAAGWFAQVRPLSGRLRETVEAAERVAGGDYESLIDDRRLDEIGHLSRGIDQLAQDLSADIAARERAEEQLRYQAHHDALTGLYNRQHAEAAVCELDDEDALPFTALFLDLDGFKEINDTHGHGTGDKVLCALADRLRGTVPSNALTARWGGDEFLVLLSEATRDETEEVAAKLTRAFRAPVLTTEGQHTVGVSVGFACSSDHETAAKVVLAADADMFRTKHNRRSTKTVSPTAIRMVESALAEDRVEPFFQPVVKLNDAGEPQMVGAEALVRIRRDDGSIIAPLEFLPALGSNELAAAIDARMMEKSFRYLDTWHRQGIVQADFRVALNMGPASINDPSLTERLGEAMALHNIEPRWCLIEIPETVETVAPQTLSQLRELGVGLAIDDVGVAYSNLERMVDLSADIAKLDRRWIPDLATAETSKLEILHGLVVQCRSLGLDVIAEGVETEEQVDMLRDLGVDVFQGYFFGRPVSSEKFRRLWCAEPTNVRRFRRRVA